MDWLARHTLDALDQHADRPLCVAFSGGGDSTVLLDVLASLPQARERNLRALHVDHGLHPASSAWAEHCRTQCERLAVPLSTIEVRVESRSGRGPEAAARDARMQAFAEHMADEEILLLAHHRDDQVETILLKLLRGAGPHGLAGMHPWRSFARGKLWRPWLDVPRQAIHEWLVAHELDFIDDPANADPDMTRSWLREQIMPRIREHLPQASASIVQSGRLCADTRDYLDHQVAALDERIGADGSLDAREWLSQPAALRGLALERWLHRQGLDAPTIPQRRELERQIADAEPDRVPKLHWPGTDVRLWRGRLHAMRPLPAVPTDWQASWSGETLQLPLGELRLVPAEKTALPSPSPSFARKRESRDFGGCSGETPDSRFRGNDPPETATSPRLPDLQKLTVRLRRGGEYLHPAGDVCGRELRYIFQQHGLPPWLRPYCPLICHDDELLAVGGLCLTQAGAEYFAPLGVRAEWRYHV